MCSLLRSLVRKIAEILFHERAVFLRVFLGLRLEYGGAVATGELGECAGTRGATTSAVGAAGAGPIAVVTIALWRRGALAFSFALPLSLTLSLAFAFSFAGLLSLAGLRAETGLGE